MNSEKSVLRRIPGKGVMRMNSEKSVLRRIPEKCFFRKRGSAVRIAALLLAGILIAAGSPVQGESGLPNGTGAVSQAAEQAAGQAAGQAADAVSQATEQAAGQAAGQAADAVSQATEQAAGQAAGQAADAVSQTTEESAGQMAGQATDSAAEGQSTPGKNVSVQSLPGLLQSGQQSNIVELTIADQNGDPVPEVYMNICTDDSCTLVTSDADGVIRYEGEAGMEYHLQFVAVPEGYSFDPETEVYVEAGAEPATLTIRRD